MNITNIHDLNFQPKTISHFLVQETNMQSYGILDKKKKTLSVNTTNNS